MTSIEVEIRFHFHFVFVIFYNIFVLVNTCSIKIIPVYLDEDDMNDFKDNIVFHHCKIEVSYLDFDNVVDNIVLNLVSVNCKGILDEVHNVVSNLMKVIGKVNNVNNFFFFPFFGINFNVN